MAKGQPHNRACAPPRARLGPDRRRRGCPGPPGPRHRDHRCWSDCSVPGVSVGQAAARADAGQGDRGGSGECPVLAHGHNQRDHSPRCDDRGRDVDLASATAWVVVVRRPLVAAGRLGRRVEPDPVRMDRPWIVDLQLLAISDRTGRTDRHSRLVALAALPFLGSFLLLLLLLAGLTALYLWRSGRLNLPALGTASSPEADARRILAERLARGDINSEEFMERASILNWTPGSDSTPNRNRRPRA
jgi:putative membrane protein